MFCTKCGQELDSNNKCTNPSCPSNMSNSDFDNINFSKTNETEFRDMNGISALEFMEFVGDKNTDYYVDKWSRNQENPNFLSWNWPAFFTNFWWFLYRKLYSYAAIIFAVLLVSALFLPDGLNSIVRLATFVGSGLLANQLYIKDSITKIIRVKRSSMNQNEDILLRRLRSNGGVNILPVLILLAIVIFILLIIIAAFAYV